MADPATIPLSVQTEASQAIVTTITDGQVGDAPSDLSSAQVIDIGINALAALTGVTPQALKQQLQIGDIASMSEYQRTMALVSLRQYADDHADEIRNNLRPENLAAMSQGRRDAIRNFYAQVGCPLEGYDTPPSPGETDAQRAQRQAAILAEAVGSRDAFGDFFTNLFMMIARALGLEDFANAIMGTRQPDDTPTGRAINDNAPPLYDQVTGNAALDAIISDTQGRGTISGVINLANNLRGQRESGRNGGPLVRACMGYEGDPWCGGFVRYCFERMGVRGVYDQPDFRGAASYAHQAARYGAYHNANSGYQPRPGDVIILSSNVSPSGRHVGIITGVDADGNITYIAGNDSNGVTQHTFHPSNPQVDSGHRVVGYCDTQRIAAARGIDIERIRSPEQAVGRSA